MSLNEKIEINGTIVENRVVIQPMEGCDCNTDGSPSELTVRKYKKFVLSGAGIIWFEANAVCKEGRTTERQMMLTRDNLPVFQKFVKELKEEAVKEIGFAPKFLLQLTHSGRQSIVPMIAYRNPVYEATRPVSDENIVSDEYLDSLPEKYYQSALLAREAGFDGVDMKCCHGYLVQELLSAYNRAGRYGGSLENRARLYIESYQKLSTLAEKDFMIASRFDPSDMVKKPYGFGTDENNNLDLTEAKEILHILQSYGLKLVNITLGNPYYNPHVNRPFRVGAYRPDESAEVGLKRFVDVEAELKKEFPDMVFVGSGLSYYRDDMMEQAEKQIENKVCDLVGFGRCALAYPEFYRDYLGGKYNYKKACVACSKCTVLMRNKRVSGCATFDEYYKNLYREIEKK